MDGCNCYPSVKQSLFFVFDFFYPSHFRCWNYVTNLNHRKWLVTESSFESFFGQLNGWWLGGAFKKRKKKKTQTSNSISLNVFFTRQQLTKWIQYGCLWIDNISWTHWKRVSWQWKPTYARSQKLLEKISVGRSQGVSRWLQYSQCFSIFLSQNTCCYGITGEAHVKWRHCTVSEMPSSYKDCVLRLLNIMANRTECRLL